MLSLDRPGLARPRVQCLPCFRRIGPLPSAASRSVASVQIPRVAARIADAIATHKYWQFEFFRQWRAVQAYAHERGIKIMGDIPIYVAHDSADVWSNRQAFKLSEDGRPLVQAGVPPDYFSATGQLWGNPIYDWQKLLKDVAAPKA